MSSPPARRAHNATNALHSLIYFAPETEERLVAAGLEAAGAFPAEGVFAPRPAR